MISASAPRLPNFIVIGAAKCGTTSLNYWLARHPQVFMCPRQEPSYFAHGIIADDRPHVATLAAYQHLFRRAGDARAVGEVSPVYMRYGRIAKRISETLPDARILAALRDPVERAWSDYLMMVRKGGERQTPEAALAPGGHYAEGSRYHHQLLPYYRRFGAARVRVCLFDVLVRDPDTLMAEVLEFLGVDPSVRLPTGVRLNAGGLPRSRALYRLARLAAGGLARLAPGRTARSGRLAQWLNDRSAVTPEIPDDIARRLREALAPETDRLAALIGQDLDHWLPR